MTLIPPKQYFTRIISVLHCLVLPMRILETYPLISPSDSPYCLIVSQVIVWSCDIGRPGLVVMYNNWWHADDGNVTICCWGVVLRVKNVLSDVMYNATAISKSGANTHTESVCCCKPSVMKSKKPQTSFSYRTFQINSSIYIAYET